jgi:ParB-like nuclease domain
MFMTGSSAIDAERAFTRAARGRRRAALARRLRRGPADGARLCVYGEPQVRRPRASGRPGVREIPIDAINGTLEPSRAATFDRCFRPAGRARSRWERVWLAEHQGAVLPPISVVPVDGGYAVRDGHHRVSVAKARGALSIDAMVDAA